MIGFVCHWQNLVGLCSSLVLEFDFFNEADKRVMLADLLFHSKQKFVIVIKTVLTLRLRDKTSKD